MQNYRYILIALLIGILIISPVGAQNLVPNPGFEEFTELPDVSAEFGKVKEWFNPAGEDVPAVSEYGTPDFFHKRGGMDVRIPSTRMGYVSAFRGEAIVGLILYNKYDEDLVDFREYLCVPLKEALQVGIKYKVELHFSTGVKNHYGQWATPNLQVSFTEEKPKQNGHKPLPFKPYYATPETKFNTGWQRISFEFVADFPHRYLIIGNFQNDKKTKLEVRNKGKRAGECAYYFIDEVSVKGEGALSLTCPEDQRSPADPGRCDKAIDYGQPILEGPVGTKLTLVEGSKSGELFSIGKTTVRYQAKSPDGLVEECEFKVEIWDQEIPVIKCPEDIVVPRDPAVRRTIVKYPPATATDNCGEIKTRLIEGPSVKAGFLEGSTQVTYRAVDKSNNGNDCSFTVTVGEKEDGARMECPENITVNTAPGRCDQVVEYDAPKIVGITQGKLSLAKGPRSGGNFPKGITEVIYSLKQSGAPEQRCVFEVAVEDQEAPELECPEDIVVDGLGGENYSVVDYKTPSASDNCDRIEPVLVEGKPSGAEFPIGTTRLQFKGEDEAGNKGECSFQVTVVGVESPPEATPEATSLTLKCPQDMVVSTSPDRCDKVVAYPKPEWTGPDGSKFGRVSGKLSREKFALGEHKIRYRVQAPSGEEKECEFQIKVLDKEPPKINCPDDFVVKAGPGELSMKVDYPEVEATDNCGTAVVKMLDGKKSGMEFPLGDTRLKYQATDAAGNKSECSFVVQVEGLPEKVGEETVAFQKGVITTNSESITIYFYDAQVKDNDIISINVDGEWVLQESKIKKKRSDFWKTDNISVTLKPDQLHYMVFQANDEGSIPPCTISLMIVDDKRNLIAERTVSFKIGESGGVAFKMK